MMLCLVDYAPSSQRLLYQKKRMELAGGKPSPSQHLERRKYFFREGGDVAVEDDGLKLFKTNA